MKRLFIPLLAVTFVAGCARLIAPTNPDAHDALYATTCAQVHGGYEQQIFLTVAKDGAASVTVFGEKQEATYTVKGVKRHFEWGDKGQFEMYINPSQYALFYDFSGVPAADRIKPSLHFECRQSISATLTKPAYWGLFGQ